MSFAVWVRELEPGFAWFAEAVALTLLFMNVLLLVVVHARRVRGYFRRRRAGQFEERVEVVLRELDPATRKRDPRWLATEIAGFDELERPIAATMLIERLRPASEEERMQTLTVLREAGVVRQLGGMNRRRWVRTVGGGLSSCEYSERPANSPLRLSQMPEHLFIRGPCAFAELLCH
jgi:hypothetical protein